MRSPLMSWLEPSQGKEVAVAPDSKPGQSPNGQAEKVERQGTVASHEESNPRKAPSGSRRTRGCFPSGKPDTPTSARWWNPSFFLFPGRVLAPTSRGSEHCSTSVVAHSQSASMVSDAVAAPVSPTFAHHHRTPSASSTNMVSNMQEGPLHAC
jgi:hypothetical protein